MNAGDAHAGGTDRDGTDPGRVVVVGAGLAGGRTCVALREAGFAGPIVLLGDEPHPPYDRPPLTKATLTDGADPDLGLDLEMVDFRPGTRVTSLDPDGRVLETDRGPIGYDTLVLATGMQPVTLPGTGEQRTLRTREDAEALRAELRPGARLVIIGAGWIGAEVATAAIAAGCVVTCVDEASGPLGRVLGDEVAARMTGMWAGIDLRTGVRVREIAPEGVVLSDGSVVEADVVLTAVGVRADLDWLREAGLETAGGALAVDADQRTSLPGVYAVGDVAARWSDRIGDRAHTGHWDSAASGARSAAAAILGRPAGSDEVPYFWSDQFGVKIQYVGQHHPGDRLVIREHPEKPDKWGCAWLDSEDRLTGHLSVGLPRAMVQARAALLRNEPVQVSGLSDLTAVL
ncbi:NAD(P)/FAD-dependent oxidoreductase [Dietzia aurantiaca]|uniref:NAD(P)/FAD-dependent oxidoreductase n=1 Tax=Dietzia aurantiaca TaxID=983873 RepID=A0ABV9PP39_9ACTN